VRVPTLAYQAVAQALDLGASGVTAPMVESPEQARDLVRYARYPPRGRRGAAFGFARDGYREPGDLPSVMEAADRETLLVALVETVPGIEAVHEIAAVDGIDVVWLGQYDLSLSLGMPGMFTDSAFRECVDRLLEACRRHGKAAGYMVSSVDEARNALAAGFRCIAYSNDVALLRRSLSEGVSAIRSLVEGR
jgi:2-dehydro-3-deoxyglucarate aldolase/4-hydroxy-2-oxoheptanedioate aldolase